MFSAILTILCGPRQKNVVKNCGRCSLHCIHPPTPHNCDADLCAPPPTNTTPPPHSGTTAELVKKVHTVFCPSPPLGAIALQ